MFSTLKHYLAVYNKFLSTSFTEAVGFRLNFSLLIILDIFFYFSVLGSANFIFDHVQNIGPWNKDQLLFFLSFMLAIDQLHMTFLSEAFWMLSFNIRKGDLDYVLLKPIHSIFSVFFRYVRPSSMCNIFVTWGLMIYYGQRVHLHPIAWVLLPFMVILGFILLALVEFIISASMFWVTEGFGINFLRMQLQQLSRWPDYIYAGLSRRVFTVLMPVLLIGSGPIHFMFNFHQWHLLAGMLVAIVVLWFLLLKIWDLALRRYDSASS